MQSPNASKVTEILGEKAGHSSHKMSEGKHISKKMITNKKVGGWPSCSSKCKTGKAGSQIPSGKDATHLDDPSSGDVPATSTDLQTTSQSQQGFPDKIFLLASVIFQNNHLEKPANHQLVNYGKKRGLPIPEVKDEEMQRKAYELAFSTLTYQELLEDIMMDSRLYLTQPMPDDQMSLVAVMLYDFQDRKFLPWEHLGKEEIIEEVEEVENYLLKFKTRLAASLARCRIKHDLLSISCILPESVKVKQKRSSSLPLYAWVNALKSSLDEVQGGLKSAGFSQVKSIGQLEGQTFCQDPHCGDILVFPAQLKAQLHSTKLLSDHKLIIQDKSCCLGPYAVCALLPEEGDVLIVGCFSAPTVSHTASLIAEKQRANCNGQPTVYVCVSNCTDTQREELQQAATAMGCKNVKLIQEDFLSLYGGDKRLRKVRVILLTPKCSVSAVSNPVEFILRENGDTDLLQDLSRGSIAQSKLETLVTQQRKDIDHALKFPGISAVVYSTCSSYREENEEVVSRALEQAKAHSDQEGKPREAANFRLSPSPFSLPDHAENPFFMLESSEESNGCFLAVISREPEPVVEETPQEVLLRANAKGILDRIGSNQQPTRKEKRGHASRTTKTTHARTSQPQLSVSIQSKSAKIKGSNSTTACGHQEFPNRRQSSKGKAKALCLQASKNAASHSFSSSEQESTSSSSSSSSSKPENMTPKKIITPVFNITTSTLTMHPAPSPATPRTSVVRPRRAHQEVLKPTVFTLPPDHFPNFFPPQNSTRGFCHSFNYKWRPAPAVHLSCSGLSKAAVVKPRPLF